MQHLQHLSIPSIGFAGELGMMSMTKKGYFQFPLLGSMVVRFEDKIPYGYFQFPLLGSPLMKANRGWKQN